jgi:hypothetical protein
VHAVRFSTVIKPPQLQLALGDHGLRLDMDHSNHIHDWEVIAMVPEQSTT